MLTCPACGTEWSDSYKACPLDGSALVSAPSENSRLGPYKIIDQLGGGGMARIYRALSPQGQEVALKVLFSSRDSNDSIARFIREGQILATLDHPNIVKVLDAGATEEGSHYLAMELLHGEDLSARLKRTGPISIEEARALAQQILDALELSHSAGIVHRDLKPSNIWLCEGEFFQSKLIDFGIALTMETNSRLTMAGKIVGTPAYLAPEQLRGDEFLDSRADIYSFGVTLYEALTGHLPIEAPDAISLMVRVASEPPVSPKTYRPDLPKEFISGLLRSLEKEPERRFSTANEFAQALAVIPSRTAPISGEFQPAAFSDTWELQSDRRVTIVLLERIESKKLSGFVGRAVESLRSNGGMAEPLGNGRVAAVFGVNSKSVIVGTDARRAVSCALSLRHPGVKIAISTDPLSAAAGYQLQSAGASLLISDARPGEILVDQETFTQIENWVDAEVTPSNHYAVRGVRRGQSHFRQVLGIETPTVGRETELARVRAAIGGTSRSKRPRGLLFLGEEGIGKSRLLQESKLLAEQTSNALFLFGSAEPHRQSEPFGLFSHLLSSLSTPPFQLPPEPGSTLSPLDHGLRRSLSAIEDALFAWLANLSAERLVLLLLEDIHFADQESLRVLSRVLSSSAGSVMVLATSRPELLSDPMGAQFAAQASRLDLLPLEVNQTVGLLQAILGLPPDDFLVERVYEVSLGNPMVLEELLRALADIGVLQQTTNGVWLVEGDLTLSPMTWPRVLATRMSALTPEAQTLLQRASVFGASFPIDALPSLGVVKPGALLEILQSREFLLSEMLDGVPAYRFRYRGSQQFWYSALPPESVSALHRNAGRWIKEQNRGEPCLLAWHARHGDRPRKAARYLHEVGLIAFLRGSDTAALSQLDEAARMADVELELFEILADREEILFQMSHIDDAWRDTETMHQIAESLGDEPRRGRALLCRGRLWLSEDPERAQAALGEALPLLTIAKDSIGIAACHFYLSVALRQLGDMEQSLRFAKAAHRMTQELGRRGLELDVVSHLSVLSRDLGDFARSIRAAERGLALARRSGDKAKEAPIVASLGELASQIGRYEEAESHLREALLLSPESQIIQRTQLASVLLKVGRIDEAFLCIEDAQRAMSGGETQEQLAALELCQAEVLWLRGAPGDNSRGVSCAENVIQRLPQSWFALRAQILFARRKLQRRDLDGTFFHLEQAEMLRQKLGPMSPHEEELAFVWSLALRAAGREQEAQTSLFHAQSITQTNANRISDEELRRSYLERVPLCREIFSERQ